MRLTRRTARGTRRRGTGRCCDFKLLQYALERDVEEECRVRRYLGSTSFFAVAQLTGHDELAPAADAHAGDALVPALDNAADSGLVGEGLLPRILERAAERGGPRG